MGGVVRYNSHPSSIIEFFRRTGQSGDTGTGLLAHPPGVMYEVVVGRRVGGCKGVGEPRACRVG